VTPLHEEFCARAKAALEAMMAMPGLRARVRAGLDEFFAKYPALGRTPEAEGIVASLIIERLSLGADSQSAAGSEPEKKKVA
jgi:hypothetical protein